MNKKERTKMVKAMEFIARNMNDEGAFCNLWLPFGVADGDIEYGDLSDTDGNNSDTEYYTEDNNFSDLMKLFLKLMAIANSNGLYCDGILSGKKYYSDFMDDGDKMVDFFKLSKEEFLKSYSYLNEEEYDATLKKVKEFTKER